MQRKRGTIAARRATRVGGAFLCGALLGGCSASTRPDDVSASRDASGDAVPIATVPDLDLLLVVDNSGSMRENQANLMAQFEPFLGTLIAPPCTNPSNPAPHACEPGNATDQPIHRAVRSLHVGVISSDLGTRGSSVPGCANSDLGDDGLLNPIRYGHSLRTHLPFTAPMGFRPADCTDPNQFPSFITFDSARAPGAIPQLAHDMRCYAGLYVGGCGIEQPLESMYRALVWHDARDALGNRDPNAGFVRADALLAILMLTDEEDGSVRDCRFNRPDGPDHIPSCQDATSVFDSSSNRNDFGPAVERFAALIARRL